MSILLALALMSSCAESQGCGGQPSSPALDVALENLRSAVEEAEKAVFKEEQDEADRDLEQAEEAAKAAQASDPAVEASSDSEPQR